MSDCSKCGATGDEICMCDTDDSIDLGLCMGCQQREAYIDGMCAQCIDDELDD